MRDETERYNKAAHNNTLISGNPLMLKEIPPSPTMSVFQLANEKKARGETVFNFSAGDPALANHPAIAEMTHQKMSRGIVPYPPVEGIHELREAFTNWINSSCHLAYKPDECAVTCGGKFAIYAVLSCFMNPGEEILMVAPYYVSYPGIAAVIGATTKTIETSAENGWKITPQDLAKEVSANTKFLILNSACNPTGVIYTKEELYALLLEAKKLGIYVISDEVYSGLVYEANKPFVSCGVFPEFRDILFIVQSCSKNFAMSGWRVGFILAEKVKLARIKSFQQQTTSGVSLLSQWGALGAIEKGDVVNAYVRKTFERRLELFVDTFNSMFPTKIKKPSSALYTFIPLSTLGVDPKRSSKEVSEWMIKEGNIATVPGEAFGTNGYIRFACSEMDDEIEQGVRAMHRLIYPK